MALYFKSTILGEDDNTINGVLEASTLAPMGAADAEEGPTLAPVAAVGVVLVMLVGIAAIFVLGVLLDCRQQKIIEKQMRDAKRMRLPKRGNVVVDVEADIASIANNMEALGLSTPPAQTGRGNT